VAAFGAGAEAPSELALGIAGPLASVGAGAGVVASGKSAAPDLSDEQAAHTSAMAIEPRRKR